MVVLLATNNDDEFDDSEFDGYEFDDTNVRLANHLYSFKSFDDSESDDDGRWLIKRLLLRTLEADWIAEKLDVEDEFDDAGDSEFDEVDYIFLMTNYMLVWKKKTSDLPRAPIPSSRCPPIQRNWDHRRDFRGSTPSPDPTNTFRILDEIIILRYVVVIL